MAARSSLRADVISAGGGVPFGIVAFYLRPHTGAFSARRSRVSGPAVFSILLPPLQLLSIIMARSDDSGDESIHRSSRERLRAHLPGGRRKDEERSVETGTSKGSKRQRLKSKLKFWSHSDSDSERDVPEPDEGGSGAGPSRGAGNRRRSSGDGDSSQGNIVDDGSDDGKERRSRRQRVKDKLKSAIPFIGHSDTTSTSSSSYAEEQAAKAEAEEARAERARERARKEEGVPPPFTSPGAGTGVAGAGVSFVEPSGGKLDFGAAAQASAPDKAGYVGRGGDAYGDDPGQTDTSPGWDPAVSPGVVAAAMAAAGQVSRAFEAGAPGWPYEDLALQQLYQKVGEGVIASALAATKLAHGGGGGGGGRPLRLDNGYGGGGERMGDRERRRSDGGRVDGGTVSRSFGSPQMPMSGSTRSSMSSSSASRRRHGGARSWRPTGVRRALLVGIAYEGKAHLPGTLNDVQNVVKLLSSTAAFHRRNMVILTDSGDPGVGGGVRTGPATRASILREMRALVSGATAGDSLFFHFSGHGSQVIDKSSSGGAAETDGMDETLVPSDWTPSGDGGTNMIVDDEVYQACIEPLPEGVRLTACFDACHSGTAADLPHTFRVSVKTGAGGGSAGGGPMYAVAKVESMVEARTGRPLRADKAVKRSGHARGQGDDVSLPRGEAIVFSACADGGTAADTSTLASDGTPAGAMTYAFCKAMRSGGKQGWKDMTYTELLGRMTRTIHKAAPNQEARLSVSMPDFDPNTRVRL